MGYVFKNMIAKFVSSAERYRTSTGVLQLIQNDENLSTLVSKDAIINMKKYFYGKDKPTLLEHMIPASVIAKLLVTSESKDKSTVENILSSAGEVAVILRSEDELLTKHPEKLKSKMPNGWQIGDPYTARYDTANIILSDIWIRRDKSILR